MIIVITMMMTMIYITIVIVTSGILRGFHHIWSLYPESSVYPIRYSHLYNHIRVDKFYHPMGRLSNRLISPTVSLTVHKYLEERKQHQHTDEGSEAGGGT